jgi:hypothetical protein
MVLWNNCAIRPFWTGKYFFRLPTSMNGEALLPPEGNRRLRNLLLLIWA